MQKLLIIGKKKSRPKSAKNPKSVFVNQKDLVEVIEQV